MSNARAPSIRVFLIAQPLIVWGLERLVQSASRPCCELAGSATSVEESLFALRQQRADVAILAVGALPTETVIDFCARSGVKTLLLTGSRDSAWLDSVMIGGVRGVVHTEYGADVLLKAVEKVHQGELWIDRGATARIFLAIAARKAAEWDDPERSKIATLTHRERQTIAALASDASAQGKVLAGRLCISEHTLRNHLTSIYDKLGVSNRLDLYAYATRHRLNELG